MAKYTVSVHPQIQWIIVELSHWLNAPTIDSFLTQGHITIILHDCYEINLSVSEVCVLWYKHWYIIIRASSTQMIIYQFL